MNPAVAIVIIGIVAASIIFIKDIITTPKNNKILKDFRNSIKPNDEFMAFNENLKKHKKYVVIFKEFNKIRALDVETHEYGEFEINEIYKI